MLPRRLVQIAVALLLSAALAGCDWLGANDEPKLKGKRIDALTQTSALVPDPGRRPRVVLPPPQTVPDWPQAGGFPPHAMYHLALGDNPRKIWQTDLGEGAGKRRGFITQPIVIGKMVIAMDADSVVSAYNLADGNRLWTTDTVPSDTDNGAFGGGLAYDQGAIFVTTRYGEILSLNPLDGKIWWRKRLPSPAMGAPSARAGRVLVITNDNETLALSADDGHELWHHNGTEESATLMGGSSPAIDGDTVISAYSSGELFALRIENGTILWVATVGSLSRNNLVMTLNDIGGLPVIDRGRVFVASNNNFTGAFDVRTGRQMWEREAGSAQTPWVAGNFLYVLTNTPQVVCFEASSGRIVWARPLRKWKDPDTKKDQVVWSGPVLGSDRLVIVGSDGVAMAISPYSGRVLGEIELPDGVTIPPILADKTLLFVTNEGDLVAYR
jgi:outer membrane protein assembly factor BamB